MYTMHSRPIIEQAVAVCDSVLTGAGFGDDALLAEAFCEEDLAHRVIDLVGSGVGEIFAL